MGWLDKLTRSFRKQDPDTEKRYTQGLGATRKGFGASLRSLLLGNDVDEEAFLADLKRLLIRSDVSVRAADKLIRGLRKDYDLRHPEGRMGAFIDYCMRQFDTEESLPDLQMGALNVIMLVGVNGSGKTTTAAKLAVRYQKQGFNVQLIAADTFRAAAVRQLEIWAERTGTSFFCGKAQEDPASVVVRGLQRAKEIGSDLVIIDTAGRLQSSVNLMNELSKIRRVIDKQQPDQLITYLVIDANTGQNGLLQAQAFNQATHVDALILSKLDGSARGGVILSIQDLMHLPVAYVGLGETPEDLEPFDFAAYLHGLIGEDEHA